MSTKKCTLPGCTKWAFQDGLCTPHWQAKAEQARKAKMPWECQRMRGIRGEEMICLHCNPPDVTICQNCGGRQDGTGGNKYDEREQTGAPCFACKIPIDPLIGGTEYQGKTYHKNCKPDPEKACPKCGLNIIGTFKSAMGKKFHPDCLRCVECNGDLSAGFVQKDGQPVCAGCTRKQQGNTVLGAGPTGTGALSGGEGQKFCGECGSRQNPGKFCQDCGAKM